MGLSLGLSPPSLLFLGQSRHASGETPQPPAMPARRSGDPSCSEMYPLVNETFPELVPSNMNALDVSKQLQNKNRATS
jgi:hypothetical protein